MTVPARLVAVAPGPRLRRGPGRVGGRPEEPRRPPVLSLAFLIVWWFLLGPVGLGGPATFAIVDGRSMEPTYLAGDLVIARERVTYEVGDVVVFSAPDRRRYVIHRIVDGDALEGWVTRGDNNDRDDAWSVPDEAILGREWMVLPRVGATVAWTKERPFLFAGVVGMLVALSGLLERRRDRPHPALDAALADARRVPGSIGRPVGDMVVVVAAAAAVVSAVVSLGRLALVGLLASSAAAFAAGLAVVALAVGVPPLRRLIDGVGLPEPAASRRVLAGRCWAVEELPELGICVDHGDARALRAIADRNAGRVLRCTERIHPDGHVRDTFLTIDADGTGHRWVAAGPDPDAAPEAVVAPAAIAVPAPPAVPEPAVPAPTVPARMTPEPTTPTFDVLQDRLDGVLAELEVRLAGLRAGIDALSSVRT